MTLDRSEETIISMEVHAPRKRLKDRFWPHIALGLAEGSVIGVLSNQFFSRYEYSLGITVALLAIILGFNPSILDMFEKKPNGEAGGNPQNDRD